MSDADTRVARLRAALDVAFMPDTLDIRDDSLRHSGHPGARDGRGHFKVLVVSKAFDGLTAVQRHRAVYAAVGDMMETDIHALQIEARVPDQV